MFLFLILDLNIVKDETFLISFGSLDHRYGPKYLIECLPYSVSNSVEIWDKHWRKN